MRHIYLVSHGQLDGNKFNFYRTEAFSSLKKAEANIDNVIECNKGFDVELDSYKFSDVVKMVNYTWTSKDPNRDVKSRLMLEKVELR